MMTIHDYKEYKQRIANGERNIKFVSLKPVRLPRQCANALENDRGTILDHQRSMREGCA